MTKNKNLAGWRAAYNQEDDCVDIDYKGEPIDAYNEIGWSTENLKPKNALFIPKRVRDAAESIWRSQRRGDEVSIPMTESYRKKVHEPFFNTLIRLSEYTGRMQEEDPQFDPLSDCGKIEALAKQVVAVFAARKYPHHCGTGLDPSPDYFSNPCETPTPCCEPWDIYRACFIDPLPVPEET